MPTGHPKNGINKGWFKKGQLLGVKRAPFSEETKKKMSISSKGKTVSEETKKKMSLASKHKSGMRGKKHSLEARLKMSAKRKGELNANWQGGKKAKHLLIRVSLEYKLWRKSVFERDNYTCIFCGFQSNGTKIPDIHADHIKPFAYYPELRFAIDNGRTLCVPCHRTTDTYGVKKHVYI